MLDNSKAGDEAHRVVASDGYGGHTHERICSRLALETYGKMYGRKRSTHDYQAILGGAQGESAEGVITLFLEHH
jgi:hypothetical protein